MPVSSRSGRISMPGVVMSIRKHPMPSWRGATGSVRARQIAQWARSAIVVHTFSPVIDQPPSTSVAAVVSDARSLPAPGSENIWHHVISPRSDGPTQRSCCSAVPCPMMVGSTQPATWRWSRRTRAAFSSASIASCSIGDASSPHGRGQWGTR